MDPADDLRDVLKTAKERVSSPLIGSFVISWCVWNYPVFLYAITGDSLASSRVDLIRRYFETVGPLSYVVFPAGAALVYVFLYPVVRRQIAVYHEDQRCRTNTAVYTRSGKTPVLPEENEELKTSLKLVTDRMEALVLKNDSLEADRRAVEKKHKREMEELASQLASMTGARDRLADKLRPFEDDAPNVQALREERANLIVLLKTVRDRFAIKELPTLPEKDKNPKLEKWFTTAFEEMGQARESFQNEAQALHSQLNEAKAELARLRPTGATLGARDLGASIAPP